MPITRDFAQGAGGRATRAASTTNPAVLFVSEYGQSETVVFDRAGHVLQRIPIFGLLAVDREGNLYIATPNGTISVRMYAPPYNGKPTLITPGDNQQVNTVVVDHKTDMFVIITQANYSSGGPGQLRFYRHGETVPCRVVPPQRRVPTFYYTGAFDAQGNLFFAAGNSSNPDVIASTPGGCEQSGIAVYAFSNNFEAYGNVAFDAQNNFVIQSFVNDKPDAIFTYAHPVNGSFGEPLFKTVLPFYKGTGPDFLTMDSTGSYAWASFVLLEHAVKRYNYPVGGSEVQSIGGLKFADQMAVYPNYVPCAESFSGHC
jgi:hypothetical protein